MVIYCDLMGCNGIYPVVIWEFASENGPFSSLIFQFAMLVYKGQLWLVTITIWNNTAMICDISWIYLIYG